RTQERYGRSHLIKIDARPRKNSGPAAHPVRSHGAIDQGSGRGRLFPASLQRSDPVVVQPHLCGASLSRRVPGDVPFEGHQPRVGPDDDPRIATVLVASLDLDTGDEVLVSL